MNKSSGSQSDYRSLGYIDIAAAVRSILFVEKVEKEKEQDIMIFDDELSAKQIRNIEAELKVKILDRTSLILDIPYLLCRKLDVYKRQMSLPLPTHYLIT